MNPSAPVHLGLERMIQVGLMLSRLKDATLRALAHSNALPAKQAPIYSRSGELLNAAELPSGALRALDRK